MRKIIYAQLVSADGYIEDRDGKIDWTKPGCFQAGVVMMKYKPK